MTSQRRPGGTAPITRVLVALAGIVCFPIVACMGGFELCGTRRIQKAQRKEMAKARRRKMKDQPKPLEEARKRELSPEPARRRRRSMAEIFSSRKKEKDMRITFLQLPSEILGLILLEVLGGNTFHIIQCRQRLGHLSCKKSHVNHATNLQYDLERTCIPSLQRRKFMTHEWMRYYNSPPSPFYTPSDSCLDVLLTCRQLYLQGIPIIYSRNIFDINNPETLLYLSQTILPARLKMIKFLQIDVNASMLAYDNSMAIEHPSVAIGMRMCSGWRRCLDMVASMKGLENLRVRMDLNLVKHSPGFPNGNERFKRYLESMLDAIKLSSVRGLRRFDLETCGPDIEGIEQLLERVRDTVCA
ncbi:hypothetical protein DSL72_008352 [Monilinia vaccinii-corymbosi]|uniref:DUF7730 domain-containing protein n=1 Tax=Monilinia vaccinii-corymbosi TaxID=61207 RepID=A0A8A3PJI3_9HELO|nr:hypothetical protein DSL72_008352 [Monilinia vaccinii-corymbosi]